MGDEVSPGGSEILRHEPRERELEPTHGDPALIEAVDRHLAEHVGEDGTVLHELVSDLVHVDVHFVPPAGTRSWSTLVTCGMAERPMSVPDGLEDYRYAELVLALPPDWPLEHETFEDESVYWPVRLLKDLARLPQSTRPFSTTGIPSRTATRRSPTRPGPSSAAR